ncbi:MAG: hypothetical protein ACRELY_05975 [Polyangiaceae bacterium]
MTPALVFFSPGNAAAQETGADTVVLRDGGMLKGNLIEILPGDHVTLQLSNGQSARIRWDVIDHIIRNGVPLNTAQPAPATAPPPAPAEQGTVLVHIDGDVDLESEATLNGAPSGKPVKGGWATMCSSPCDQEMPLSGIYRLAGSGVRASRTFKLAGKSGDHVFISADPSSKGAFVGGIVLIGVGVPVFVIGCFVELVVGIVNLASHASFGEDNGSYVDTSGAQVVGLSMMGLGAAGVITGIVLLASNGSTKLDQTITAPGQPAPKSADMNGDIFKKIPIYATHEGPRLPVPAAIPIVTGHF